MTKVRKGPKCASIGLAQDALVGVRHSSTFSRPAQRRMAGVLFADRLCRVGLPSEVPCSRWVNPRHPSVRDYRTGLLL